MLKHIIGKRLSLMPITERIIFLYTMSPKLGGAKKYRVAAIVCNGNGHPQLREAKPLFGSEYPSIRLKFLSMGHGACNVGS
jgi:hypothetical protein